MTLGECIRVVSANCQGLRNKIKRDDVLDFLLERKSANILCLQDTHLVNVDENKLNIETKCKCLINGKATNSRGVCIIFKNNFDYKIENIEMDTDGNYLIVDVTISSMSLKIINIYAPNRDIPDFFLTIR